MIQTKINYLQILSLQGNLSIIFFGKSPTILQFSLCTAPQGILNQNVIVVPTSVLLSLSIIKRCLQIRKLGLHQRASIWLCSRAKRKINQNNRKTKVWGKRNSPWCEAYHIICQTMWRECNGMGIYDCQWNWVTSDNWRWTLHCW